MYFQLLCRGSVENYKLFMKGKSDAVANEWLYVAHPKIHCHLTIEQHLISLLIVAMMINMIFFFNEMWKWSKITKKAVSLFEDVGFHSYV